MSNLLLFSYRILPPPVAWAQRKNVIFLTICVEDCKTPTITIEEDKVYFKGTGGTEKKDYEYTYELFNNVDKEVSTWHTNVIDYKHYYQAVSSDNSRIVSEV